MWVRMHVHRRKSGIYSMPLGFDAIQYEVDRLVFRFLNAGAQRLTVSRPANSMLAGLILWVLPILALADAPAFPRPELMLPTQSLGPAELAVVVNDRDPLSRRIADYYVGRRAIPAANLVHVAFDPGRSLMPVDEFAALRAKVEQATPATVQAYALTWAAPYRVGCMSITTAFAAGYDAAFCAKGCRMTKPSPYYGSDSSRPFDDLGWRPTMALAGTNFAEVKALIDRGVASDGTRPAGTGYLVKTSDAARSVRAASFDRARSLFGSAVRLRRIDADSISGRQDVLFYLTGARQVRDIRANRFLPGAIADHLTSTGGKLTDSHQMSALEWLRAGATGSYGTVVEPCNFTSKFPDPVELIGRYLNGATLIEAYWKSVRMPGQGIFIGEPLARPFGGYGVAFDGTRWVMTLYALTPGRYRLEGAEQPMGPYRPIAGFEKSGAEPVRIRTDPGDPTYFRVVPEAVSGSASG